MSLKLQSEVFAFGSDAIVWRPLQGVDLEVVVTAAWRHDGRLTREAVLTLLPRPTRSAVPRTGQSRSRS